MMNWLIDDPTVPVFASLFLGLVLATAALPKIRRPDEFQGVVANYRLLPSFMVAPFARLLPWLELCSAVALLVPLAREVAAWVAAGLFMMFALALAINVGRGRTHIDCGCVRRPTSVSRIGMFHVLRALSLAGVSLYAAFVPVNLAGMTAESGLIGVAAAAMVAMLYLAADVIVGLPDVRANKNLDFK
jgi:uncharacterized membrane protein YphA (DoxX/SURF4 family)